MLLHRALTALAGVPTILAAIWFGPPWLTALVAAAAIMAVSEGYRLAATIVRLPDINQQRGTGQRPGSNRPSGSGQQPDDGHSANWPVWLGATWAVALVLAGQLAGSAGDFGIAAALICAAGSIAGGLWLLAAWRGPSPWRVMGWLGAVPLYVGGGLGCALAMRSIIVEVSAPYLPEAEQTVAAGSGVTEAGLWWLLLTILTVYAADTGAYCVGRLVGRHRMAPRLSPGKTWEGTVGGLAAAALAGTGLAMLTPLPLAVWQGAAIGVILGIVAPAGDLLESAVKRWANVKDSGNLFPGHGGILDRLDSLIPSFAVVYLMAAYHSAAA